MYKILKIASLVLICSLLVIPTKLIAEPAKIVPVIIPQTIPEKITYYANKYNVSEAIMIQIVSCETAGSFNPTMRSECRYKFSDPKRNIVKGEQEMSYGLAQIHLPDHPNVTYEQATNPDFALKFLAENLSAGKGSMWSCYRK